MKRLIILTLILIISSCEKNKDLPILTTDEVTEITTTSALCGGKIISEGSNLIISRGVCWSTEEHPTIQDNYIVDDSTGIGNFKSYITGLKGKTTYYVRAYAKNNNGIGYGNEISFETLIQVADYDRNIYKTITIGNQVWMAENLKTTHFNNGDLIQTTNPPTLNIKTELLQKYQWAYNGSDFYVKDYGRLYTWWVINDQRGICPVGWHIPSKAEWNVLIEYVGGSPSKLIPPGIDPWYYNSITSNNSTGFTAMPGGRRNFENEFEAMNVFAYFWSSTSNSNPSAYYVYLRPGDLTITGMTKYVGNSVRCIKD